MKTKSKRLTIEPRLKLRKPGLRLEKRLKSKRRSRRPPSLMVTNQLKRAKQRKLSNPVKISLLRLSLLSSTLQLKRPSRQLKNLQVMMILISPTRVTKTRRMKTTQRTKSS